MQAGISTGHALWENRPAWEAIPPIAAAFSSWTSPRTRCSRKLGAIFRGRNAVFEMGRWTIASVVHVERFKYVLFDEAIQTMTADGFEDFAQDEKAHVAVRGICTGFIR